MLEAKGLTTERVIFKMSFNIVRLLWIKELFFLYELSHQGECWSGDDKTYDSSCSPNLILLVFITGELPAQPYVN